MFINIAHCELRDTDSSEIEDGEDNFEDEEAESGVIESRNKREIGSDLEEAETAVGGKGAAAAVGFKKGKKGAAAAGFKAAKGGKAGFKTGAAGKKGGAAFGAAGAAGGKKEPEIENQGK